MMYTFILGVFKTSKHDQILENSFILFNLNRQWSETKCRFQLIVYVLSIITIICQFTHVLSFIVITLEHILKNKSLEIVA